MSGANSSFLDWSIDSWRKCNAEQQPVYKNVDALEKVEKKLTELPPLVTADEITGLKQKLALVSQGKAFLLQCGDCAESFNEFSADNVRDTLCIMLQMGLIFSFSASMPVIKIARMAGQFAKPRSSPNETINGVTLPSYRGDIINSIEFSKQAREPNSELMLKAYMQSVETMNLIRAHLAGGLGALDRVHDWNLSFVSRDISKRYNEISAKIDQAINFIAACGIKLNSPELSKTDVFTSHEALLLNYEQALTRKDSFSKQYINGSAHMLWIGNRTKGIDDGHVELLRGVVNPIGIKIDQKTDIDELLLIIDKINPENEAGKIVLIVRMGENYIQEFLPNIIRKIKPSGKIVVWSSDPVHGNTKTSSDGNYKTREFTSIIQELKHFFAICKAEGVYGGGIHLEMTGQDVTECVGGCSYKVSESQLSERYRTKCDPRLNANQSLELAFSLAEVIPRYGQNTLSE